MIRIPETAALAFMLASPALAADALTCSAYAIKVDRLVTALTNDVDVAQAARARAEAYCGVIDFPPKVLLRSDEGTAPATDKTVIPETPAMADSGDAAALADWQRECKRRFRTFHVDDGTVVPYGSHKRVRCPADNAKSPSP